MGRKSREHRERRERHGRIASENRGKEPKREQNPADRAAELEDRLRRITDGNMIFGKSDKIPEEVRATDLEDTLAFESVDSGVSLFEGLEAHGVNLPPPESLDEMRSVEKAKEVFNALAGLRIFLTGFWDLTGRELYSKLWHETLWEGCYIEKRNPGAVTLIDVSHRMSQSEMQEFLENLQKSATIH